jgi:hypothetical protein
VVGEVLWCDLLGSDGKGLLCRGGPEIRKPHGPSVILDLLEDDLDRLTEHEVFWIAFDDVGGQPDSRVLRDGDLSHHVGRREVGKAEAMVDREGGKRRCA